MSRWFGSPRGTESPMDFEYTSRPTSGMKPVWATPADGEDPTTPRKRTCLFVVIIFAVVDRYVTFRPIGRHEPTRFTFSWAAYTNIRENTERAIYAQHTAAAHPTTARLGAT